MDLQHLPAWMALAPALHALAAATAGRGSRESAWRRAEAAALAAGGVAVLAAVVLVFVAPHAAVAHGLRADAVGVTVSLLVGFIGWAIVRYSRRYLLGEAGERRYLALLGAALAAVSLLLVADHLLLLAAAWVATSAALHRLLRFYAGRPAARLAAHKKFLSARAADALLLVAVGLLIAAYDTGSLAALVERAAVQGVQPMAQAALLLLVLTALLKCAQMPFHGWLIQVMEAPTPVSALLHAGVVNIGGFVLIRFSPLLAEAPLALGVLAAGAALTVLLAALVTGTRISIKVALAWSTVAQMGFMLLQVALGQPALALMHLVAHSLYKAHAFLAAGSVVGRQQALRLVRDEPARAGHWALAALLLPAGVLAAGIASGALRSPAELLLGAVLGAALVPLAAAGRVGAALAVAAAWFAGHALVMQLVAPASFGVPLPLVLAAGAVLALLFVLQAAVVFAPQAPAVRRLHAWAYGGFYLDEHVGRALLRRWPVPDDPATPQPAGAR